jgi:hypothetical protein
MFGTYQRLRVPVWATNREVIKAANRKIKRECRRGLKYRGPRHAMYLALLEHHANARNLCRHFKL